MEKISLKEAWHLNKRGLTIWYEHAPLLFVSSFLQAVSQNALPYATIYFSAQIINELAGAREPQRLLRLVLLTLGVELVLGILNAVITHWKNAYHEGAYQLSRKLYVEKFLSLDFAAMDDAKTHELFSQVNQNDQWSWFGIMRVLQYFDEALQAVIGILGALVLTWSLFVLKVPEASSDWRVLNHPIFIGLFLLFLLLGIFLAALSANKSDSYWTGLSEDVKLGNRFFGYFFSQMTAIKRALDVRTYRQDRLSNHYIVNGPFSELEKMDPIFRKVGFFKSLSLAIATLFTGLIYVFVGLKAWAGAFGVGSVTQYVAAVNSLSDNLSKLLTILGDMRNNAVFMKTMLAFFDIPNDMYQGSLTTEKRSDRKYEVEFRNVSFKYPHTQTYALKNISLKFKVGQRLAVVGENGSGKTTFIKLLCRLYDPTEGEILLNGIDIRKYNYQDYLALFSVVFQDFSLFSFNLGQNVAAATTYDEQKAAHCLQEAGFSGFSTSDKGLATNLYKDFDSEGVEVSGGEAQKIALARALYKDAPFIILDEPTAALDPIAEQEIYSKFNEIVGDKTAIYISHRLSSCRFCDEILVFDGGKIIQKGAHEELVTDENKYRDLWYAQAQYYQ